VTPSDRPVPTIHDVARAAGVSKSLVSLAVRGDAGVSEATRSRILAVADELGYRSNALARGLARGRTQLVGVLLSGLRNTYHAEVARGVEEAADGLGLDTIIAHGAYDAALLERRLGRLLELGVDGIVVVSAMLAPEVLDRAAARTPVVMVGRPFTPPERACVIHNHDERGATAVVEHLLAQGHSRIVHLATSRRAAARARRGAYEEAMAAAGLAAEARVLEADEGGAERIVGEVLSRAAGAPTAVFAGNDRAAAQLVDTAYDAGVAVPADLSVAGYDNSEIGALLRPRLTTVDQPRERMGREAVRLLAARMEARRDAETIVVEPALVVRDSTAAPRA